MDKLQAKYMKLNVEYELLKDMHKREMQAINDRAHLALSALEREIIWLKLQEGNNGVPSHVLEVNKQLKFIRDSAKFGAEFKRFAMEPSK